MAEALEKFDNINDLYKRILPALKTRVDEFKRAKVTNITCKNIWDYCAKNIWYNKKDLRIYEMVYDILNVSLLDIEIFIKKSNNN